MAHRIAKEIAARGVCSRREAERLIESECIAVDGSTVTHPSLQVTATCNLTLHGRPIPPRAQTQLWGFHKPKGYLCTSRDPGQRPTIFQLFSKHNLPSHVIPVGRLDFNSEGLLLLTNNGDVASRLMSPQSQIERVYEVDVFGKIPHTLVADLGAGVTINGFHYGAILARLIKAGNTNHRLQMILREGKNREIRKILTHFDLRIKRLKRTAYGPYTLGALTAGEVTPLADKPIQHLIPQVK